MSNSKLAPTILPTLTDHPRANLVPWKLVINRAARGVFAEWDTFGFLFAVCDDALWALLNTPPWGAVEGETRLPGACCPRRFQTRHGKQGKEGSVASMLSLLSVGDP